PDRDVRDGGPRSRPRLISRSDHDGETIIVLEDVRLHEDTSGILELEEVLHRPPRAVVSAVAGNPSRVLREGISSDLDVRRNETRDGWIAPPEHDVLRPALEIVVDDLDGPVSVPARQSLRIGTDLLEIGHVRMDDRKMLPVQCDSPAGALRRVAVQIA